MSLSPHFMSGNVVGTYIFELVEILGLDKSVERSDLFKERLQLSERLYLARKRNDSQELALISQQVVELAEELEVAKEKVEKLHRWFERFKAIDTARVVSELLDS